MSTKSYIELAKTYIALSNSHNLKAIKAMFVSDATYHSSYVGEYKGSAAIHAMITSFFTRFPDVQWDASEYRFIGDEGVEFDFVMTATDAAFNEPVKRHGTECIYFTPDNMIRHISVSHQTDKADQSIDA